MKLGFVLSSANLSTPFFVNMNEDQIRDAVEEATLDFSGEDELQPEA